MFKLSTLRRALAATAIFAAAAFNIAADLADLPTAKINGREMYYYEVSRGESIYTVAHKLGIDREELLKFNPSAADGVKPRMRLYFPVKQQFSQPAVESASQGEIPMTHVVKKGETPYGIARKYNIPIEQLIILNPGCDAGVKAGQRLVLVAPESRPEPTQVAQEPQYAVIAPVDERLQPAPEVEEAPVDSVETYGHPLVTPPIAPARELNVALVLPFMLNSEQPSRTSALYTEFAKGMLLAADEMRDSEGAKVNIRVYDSDNSSDSTRAIMSLPEMADVDMIVAPDGCSQLAAVIEGAPADALVLNMFNVKDDSYLLNPNVIQANIPHTPMYDTAIRGFLYRYENVLPVFVGRIGGPADKDSFVAELKQRLRDEGRDYREVNFETLLREEDIADIDPDLQPVVFVPNSGSAAEFAKIANAVSRKRSNALRPENVVIWGYPEWVTFRDESFREICDLDATIYSRFFADKSDARSAEFAERFREEFGTDMVEAVPTQGILGYDTGKFIINGLREKASTGTFPAEFSGLQSELRLVRAAGPESGDRGGLYNEALILIHFIPGGTVEKVCL